jgi:hypothetical protein
MALYAIDWPFDNILYPAVLVWKGPWLGTGIMIVLTTIANLILIKVYMRIGEDWLGVNAVEALKDRGHVWVDRLYARPHSVWSWILKIVAYLPTRVYLLVLWALKKNDTTAFIALSIYQDAFRTTAFLRHGRTDPMSTRDWSIFWGSIFVSTIYWSFRWIVIIEVIRWVYHFVRSLL